MKYLGNAVNHFSRSVLLFLLGIGVLIYRPVFERTLGTDVGGLIAFIAGVGLLLWSCRELLRADHELLVRKGDLEMDAMLCSEKQCIKNGINFDHFMGMLAEIQTNKGKKSAILHAQNELGISKKTAMLLVRALKTAGLQK